MHVASQLYIESFEASIEGEESSIADVFPDWTELERFGILIKEPLGALGASLLIQLAIANFYEVKPGRRSEVPTYPEIYLFHFGGPHGDFSYFDFWPPRKEVFLPANEPLTVLEALNSYGITRLALPDSRAGDTDAFSTGPSTWAEVGSAHERLRSCFTYSESGQIEGGDLNLHALSPRLFENIEGTLDPMPEVVRLRAMEAQSALAERITVPDIDELRWAGRAEVRYEEVGSGDRLHARDQFTNNCGTLDGQLRETYRRLSTSEALARIAGMSGV